jgi:hypothetical protein
MSHDRVEPSIAKSGLVLAAVLVVSVAAGAESPDPRLFDDYNFKLEGSWVAMNTAVRLDSKTLGMGTELRFEDDLNLDANKLLPSLSFEWQISDRHRLGARWQDISRDSNSQALKEIQWGDEIIPIDSDIRLAFDVTQYSVDWTYYPWVRERWAAGFGLGLRVLEISAELTWSLQGGALAEGAEAASVTGPLPYVNFEYRRLLSDKWRFEAGLGWLDVTIDDISGGQWLGKVGAEYLLGEHWAIGARFNMSTIDVDSEGEEFLGHVDFDINDFSVFGRFRF